MKIVLHAVLALGLATALAAARPAAAQSCTINYQRADNMWAAIGRPDGNLGTETITLQPGQTKVFVTDWKYEKKRNDGTNYYGSHMRVVTNAGRRPVRLRFRSADTRGIGGSLSMAAKGGTTSGGITLQPGVRREVKDDLMEVHCPA